MTDQDSASPKADHIIAHGNRGHVTDEWPNSTISCTDGFTVSVIAGAATYCRPRPQLCLRGTWAAKCPEPPGPMFDVPCDYPGPYSHVEVGFPSVRPEPWADWTEYCMDPDDDPTGTVYTCVPTALVLDLLRRHGGEAR